MFKDLPIAFDSPYFMGYFIVLWDYVVVDSSQKRNGQTNAKSFPSGIYPSITLTQWIYINLLA